MMSLGRRCNEFCRYIEFTFGAALRQASDLDLAQSHAREARP
jgi:hypothetical protein